MGIYNKIAKEFDGMAKEAFEAYKKSEKKLKEAEERAELYPMRGAYNADMKAKALRAQADLEEAKVAHKEATRAFKATMNDVKPIRERLVEGLNAEYRVDPSKVDMATLELMKSGVMRGNEYEYYMNKAKAEGNNTMVRLLGKFANDAAETRAKAYGDTDPEAKIFRLIANEGNTSNGKEYLDSFDSMTDVYRRCTENPAMIDHWGEFIHVDGSED